MFDPKKPCPVTSKTLKDFYAFIFAPWAKELELSELSISTGKASARMPMNAAIKHKGGVISGQAIMAAVDMVITLAMCTTNTRPKGTANQTTHFLQPANTGDLIIQAEVLRFGKTIAYAEASVRSRSSGELVARSTAEWAF